MTVSFGFLFKSWSTLAHPMHTQDPRPLTCAFYAPLITLAFRSFWAPIIHLLKLQTPPPGTEEHIWTTIHKKISGEIIAATCLWPAILPPLPSRLSQDSQRSATTFAWFPVQARGCVHAQFPCALSSSLSAYGHWAQPKQTVDWDGR